MRTTSKSRRGRIAAAWGLALLTAFAAQTAAAQASAECAPACRAGETCVNGVCMVPARPPGAQPPAAERSAAIVPSTPATLPVRERRGMMILPYLGLQSFQGSNGSGLNPGLRAGAFVGRYVKRRWSLNGQAEVDILNPNEQASSAGVGASAQMLGVAFSPLVHLGNGKAELVAGPKLGGWIQRKHLTAGCSLLDVTLEGWTLGANVGVFTPVSPSMLFGGMLSLEVRDVLHACASTGLAESCSSGGASATILGFTAGLLL